MQSIYDQCIYLRPTHPFVLQVTAEVEPDIFPCSQVGDDGRCGGRDNGRGKRGHP